MKNRASENRHATGVNLESISKMKEAVKREAGFPGGPENAAGVPGKEKEHHDTIGAKPVPTKSLNTDDKNKK